MHIEKVEYCTSIQISYASHSSSCCRLLGSSLKQEFSFHSRTQPLQHHDVWRHFYWLWHSKKKKKSHPYTQAEHKHAYKRQEVYRCISTFSPWMRPAALEEFLCKSPSKSTVGLRLPTEVWSDDIVFALLARGSVSVMAKHSSASRHRWGFTGSDPVLSQMTFKANG